MNILLTVSLIIVFSLIVLMIIYIFRSTSTKKCKKGREHEYSSPPVNLHMPKPMTSATFDRPENADQPKFQVASVGNGVTSNRPLPKNFSAASQWPGSISGVYDQERCGSCWAFSTSNAFSDRLKIKHGNKYLKDGDYISPFNLAACIKCGVNKACPRVCEGNYLDEVCEYFVTDGAIAQSSIDKFSDQGFDYHCFDFKTHGLETLKAKRKYRVNIYPPSMLTNKENLSKNEEAIMREIYDHGTVSCIIKVYTPLDYRNFYSYEKGIYGSGWDSMPAEIEGYHAITIIGWGEEETLKGKVKFWIVRNSWGNTWGTQGLGRVLKGENFGMIESDIWALDV